MNDLLISVIIPVFNTEKYIREAVQSAHLLANVGEIILVEDGSKDKSLEVCLEISREFQKVRLLRHPNGKNLGAAASRNLGILSSQFNIISFLDADDYYLTNRFDVDLKIFKDNPEVMVVYSVSKILKNNSNEFFGCSHDVNELSNKKGYTSTYEYILSNDITLGDTNSLTFRKSVFSNIHLFDDRLKLHQDTELWLRIFRENKVAAGELKGPVSVARRHSGNRITKKNRKSEFRLDTVWIDNIGLSKLKEFEKKYLVNRFSRIVSNPLRPHLFRKVVFQILKRGLIGQRDFFVKRYYQLGLKILIK